ncbi:heparinase II/III family protein [Psychrobacter immobilis]|uniref:heparinase II/III domain-containing protein n=1 Tax=Psychrobacter immobilis TaxID=498 RepID=UPI0019187CB7|nr:heparinase II/III family protein [Psychrobacter immobilis]
MEMEEISNLATVEASYDGFKVDVKILLENEKVEYACYLYANDQVVYKNEYKKIEKHIFYIQKKNAINLKIKVFFRYIEDHSIKKSKYFAVSVKKDLRYSFLETNLRKVVLNNCEIIASSPEAIELYEKEGFKPRKDSTPYGLTIPINWLSDPFDDRNWMYQLHAWRMLESYFNRGNIEDLNYISKIINDWLNFEKSHNSKWLWYDMSTGLRALKISLYLKVCYEKRIDHQISDLDYLLHEHLRHLSNPKELNSGNHGLFQLHGLKSLIYILESYSNDAYNIKDVKTYANEQMGELITSQLGRYGVHTENSPDYHFFTHKRILKMVNSPWWTDLDENILNLLKLGEQAKPWLVFPNNKCVPIGDSHTGAAINRLPKLECWPHIKVDNYIGARVDGYGIVRSCESLPVEKSSFLFFQGSFNSHHHKHGDDLSFILQENGVDILIDSGKYGYQSDKYRKYFLSTRAHNTIEVDGRSTARSKEYVYGSAIEDQPKYINGFWVLRGKVNHNINEYIHDRTLVYKPNEELYIIDKVSNNKQDSNRNMIQWWHFNTNSEIDIVDNKVLVSIEKSRNIEITSVSSQGYPTFDSYRGYESRDSLIGWISKSYLKYEPTSTLKIFKKLNDQLIVLTRFKLNNSLSDKAILKLKNKEIYTEDKSLFEYLNR